MKFKQWDPIWCLEFYDGTHRMDGEISITIESGIVISLPEIVGKIIGVNSNNEIITDSNRSNHQTKKQAIDSLIEQLIKYNFYEDIL